MNKMEEKALKILNILNDNNHEAYIVGGYVRDKLLNRTSNDIDICTSATPKQIMNIFPNTSSSNYGSVKIIYKNKTFDITTFRKDLKYENNRQPVEIKYIKSIRQDLLRRDFTINTLCIDKDGKIVDYLKIMPDLDNHIIRTVGDPKIRLKEDSLRILRAIRIATILDFKIEEETKHYLKEYGYLLKNLSYQRKKQELDKIFTNINKEKGIETIVNLGLDTYLDIPNLKKIVPCSNITGIWAQLYIEDTYPFNKVEKRQIKQIKRMLSEDIHDKYVIYTYGLYISTVVYQIKKENIQILNKIYNTIPIHNTKEIDITAEEISKLLSKKPDQFLNEIIKDIEKQIVIGTLKNKKKNIINYIRKKYIQ